MDDMIIKSVQPTDHVMHLRETFEVLRKNQMNQNPEKWALEVKLGKFLGFLVSQKGVKANPKKVDIQSLAGKVAMWASSSWRHQTYAIRFLI